MTTFTAFEHHRIVETGDMTRMIAAQREAIGRGVNLLIYDDTTGAVRDVDLRNAPPPARGRPKIGVKAREVTLLPRHWGWLGTQRGGASAQLRRMVEAAMRADAAANDPKAAMDATYRFLSSIAGDLPGYEEALRALFAGEKAAFFRQIREWPEDIQSFARKLCGEG